MSSKSSRRRQRKSKQKSKNQNKQNCNYEDKFQMIEKDMTDILICAYIRQIKLHVGNTFPSEIQKICACYFRESNRIEDFETLILPSIANIEYEPKPYTRSPKYIEYQQRLKNNKLKIIKATLKFNDAFNQLNSYDKRFACRIIIKQKRYPIYKLTVWPMDNNNATNVIFNQLYFVEYILCKRYNTLIQLDLCEMNLKDNHILCLCNGIEHLIQYNIRKKQQQIAVSTDKNVSIAKHSKQKPDNKLQNNKTNVHRKNQVPKKTNNRTIYSKNKKAQREIEKQLAKMKQIQNKQQKPIEVKMKLRAIDLSTNGITDKHLSLLLRMIKKYMSYLKVLDLSSNKITNKSLAVIMKYDIKGLEIELSNCKGVTLKGLNKYQRTDYEEEKPMKYVYCEYMVRFVNEKEEGSDEQNKAKGGKYVRGKGKKFRGNRKRMLYTGMDGQETGYISDCFGDDWWNYQ